MITPFDKKGMEKRFREEFADRLKKYDYEGAIDYLIKFSEEKPNPEFHLAMGMLYLLMTQDSDDSELLYMAYREFMLQIRRDPNCLLAYRNVLAVELLRRDMPDLEKYSEWFASRGVDFNGIMDELVEAGIWAPFSDEPIDFDGFFKAGEFGTIDPYAEKVKDDEKKRERQEHKSKIIKFGGNDAANSCPKKNTGKIIRLSATEAARDEDDYGDEMLDRILQSIGEEAAEEEDASGIDAAGSVCDSETEKLKKLAESRYDMRDYASVLNILDGIAEGSDKYYYVLVMRALLYMDNGRYDEAEKSIDAALAMRGDGALAGTLACRLYEKTNRTEKISAALKKIDNADFSDCDHVYGAFRMVLDYCSDEDAIDLIGEYVDEYNILDMRLVYAQLMYNKGDRAYATEELYKLSRIFYDDVNVRYYYLLARAGVDKMPVDDEAPQEALALIAENFMRIVENGDFSDDVLQNEIFVYGLEFFVTLEFKNDKRLLKRMFDTVQTLARTDKVQDRMRDALASPYVEPIVKAIILSEILKRDKSSDFLMEIMYEPISSDFVKKIDFGSDGYYKAYSFVLALCPSETERFCALAADFFKVYGSCDFDENELAYYLFKRVSGESKANDDDRVGYAMGFKSKNAAERASSHISQKIINRKGEI